MIDRFFRFLGTVLLSCCDYVNGYDHLQYSNRRAIRKYRYQYDSDDEYNHLQINGRANSKRQNHYQYNDDSIRANLLAPSPTSVKSSNASIWSSQPKLQSNASKITPLPKLESNARGSFHPTNIGSEASNSSLLSNKIKSPSEQSNGKLNICTSSFPSKSVSSSSPQRPGVVSFAQSNIKSNTLTSSLSTKTVQSSSPQRTGIVYVQSNIKSNTSTSSLSTKTVRSSSPQRPGIVYAQSNIKLNTSTSSFSTKTVRSSSPQRPGIVYEQSNIKSNTSTSSLSTKTVRSSSPQRPGIVYAQSNIKSNTSTSSLSTKTVQSSSLLRPDATSLSNNSITEPIIITGYVVKSNLPKNSPASKPLPTELIASSSSNTSTSSFSTKTVLASSLLRPDATSLSNNSITKPIIITGGMRYVVKSNSPKNSPASKPLPAELIASSSSNTSTSSFSTKTVLASSLLRPDATSLSNNSITKPVIITGGMRYVVKSNLPKNSPASKPLPAELIASSSSNTSTSSFSTKTVLASSLLRPDATSLSNNSITKPVIITGGMRYVVKSNSPKNSLASKPLPAELIASSSSNTSTSSFSTKTVLASSLLRPDATSLSNNSITKPVIITGGMRYVVKSNSPKNSLASKPLPAEFRASSSSNAGPDPKEVGKGGTQRYEIPKNIEEMIKNDIVPPVLKMPLSPDTYADYFAALLYAEDFYCEKWSNYLLKDVVLKLREKPNPWLQDQSDKKNSKKGSNSKTQKNYPFVAFEIKEVRERRPFLLSRDHVHLRPVDKGIDFEPFHGVLFRVERGTILAEFKDDFHNQHKPSKRYDVSFSFNRVCLKRAHHAVSAVASPLLRKILFPKITSLPTQRGNVSPMDQILNHKLAPIPYLIEYEGRPPSSTVTSLIKNIVLKIYESCKESRILICTPTNRTCDDIVRLIMKAGEFDIFRANAAFREKELVPGDIMPACIYRGECFTCPPLDELQRFRIITSTFVSTFRLYNAGLKAGHFSHIFLLDAASTIEPETIVALVDLVSEETVIVVTGSVEDQPRWVRSDIGRDHGLEESFFERLRTSKPYWPNNPLLSAVLSYEDHQ